MARNVNRQSVLSGLAGLGAVALGALLVRPARVLAAQAPIPVPPDQEAQIHELQTRVTRLELRMRSLYASLGALSTAYAAHVHKYGFINYSISPTTTNFSDTGPPEAPPPPFPIPTTW